MKIAKLVAIAGPTGSGKTTLTRILLREIGINNCSIISQDNYYKDWSHLDKKKRKQINFDHTNAFDFTLLFNHLNCLKKRAAIDSPCYSFVESRRLKKQIHVMPRHYIIVEGLMPFRTKNLANIYDLKIYIDADHVTCFARRLKRDAKERGDKFEVVCARYLKNVLPMQKRFVEPQKKMADLIVDGKNEFNGATIKKILKNITTQ